MTLDNILEEIKKAQTIVVLTHESPDGDAVSSSLSVMHAISQLGKEADVIIPEYSRNFTFLPGSEKILQKTNMLIISHNKHARKWQGLYVLIISQLNESRTNNQLNHHLTHIHQAKHSYHYGRNPEDITI